MALNLNYPVITSTRIEYTSAANQTKMQPATGTFFYLSQGTDVSVTVFDDSKRKLADKVLLTAGRGFKFPEGFPAKGFSVEIFSPSAQIVSLDVIDGEIIDNTFILGSGAIIEVKPAPNGTWSDVAGTAVGAGLSVAQAQLGLDATRLQAAISNPAASANEIYVRFDNTTAASAIRVPPGSTAVVEGVQAIFVYNSGAVAITPLLAKLVT